MLINIEIHTHERRLVFDLLEKSSVTQNDEIQITDQVKLRYAGSYERKGLDFPAIIYIAVSFTSGVGASVFANWLYDKLKGKRIEKFIIEKTEIELDQGEIKRIIEEKLRIE